MLIIDYVLKSWRNYKIRMKNLDIKLGAIFFSIAMAAGMGLQFTKEQTKSTLEGLNGSTNRDVMVVFLGHYIWLLPFVVAIVMFYPDIKDLLTRLSKPKDSEKDENS